MDKKRIISSLLVLVLVFGIVPLNVFAEGNEVKAEEYIEIKVDENGNPTQETIDEIAEELEFIVEEVLVTDLDGGIIDINADKLIDRYGHSPEIDKLYELTKNKNNSNYGIAPANAFTDCVIEGILDYFGVGLLGILTSGTVYKLITKKAWKEVTKIIAKNIVKVGGKYVGVASIVVTLAYYGGKCAIKTFAYSDNNIQLRSRNKKPQQNYMYWMV